MIKKTITLCMIVKNEEEFLDQCLKSAAPLADEIIIVDTGSTDNTLKIANKYHATIIPHNWSEDFSSARNLSLLHASGDWIFILDADETIEERSIPIMKNLIQNEDAAAYYVTVINRFSADFFRPVMLVRLFKNSPDLFFSGYIHENISTSLDSYLNNHPEEVLKKSEINIIHYGYQPDIVRTRGKLKRNKGLLEKQLREDPYNCYLLMRLGEVFREEKYPERAILYLRKAYQILMKNPKAHYSLGPSLCCQYASALLTIGEYSSAGEYAAAYTVCSTGITLFSVTSSLLYTKGMAAQKLGHLDEALTDFKKCLTFSNKVMDPSLLTDDIGTSSYHALNSIGEIYRLKKDYKNAISFFKQTIALLPSYSNAQHNLAKIYIDEGRLDEALDQYRSILHYYKNDILAWISGGLVFRWKKNTRKAKQWFTHAESINPVLTKQILSTSTFLLH